MKVIIYICQFSVLSILLYCSGLNAYGTPKNVLILHSYHKNFQWTDRINQSIVSELTTEFPDCKLHIEYMDTKRISPTVIFPTLLRLYMKKYHNTRIDIIILSDDNALDFVLAYGDRLFPSVPVVFCGINKYPEQKLKHKQNITGIIEDSDLKSTIDAALQIHPDTRYIAIINDSTPSAHLHMEKLKHIIPLYQNKVSFIMLTDMTVQEIKTSLQHLPEKSIVIQMSFYRTKDGTLFTVKEGGEFITSYCKYPVYSAWDSLLYSGIVGGMLVSSTLQGKRAGQIAVKILQGISPSDISVERKSPNQFIFDYTAMNKYGIEETMLPLESFIVNRPQSLFRKNQKVICLIALAFFIQSVLIIVLVSNILLRKKAEKRSKNLQQHIEFILGATKTGINIIDADYNIHYIDSKWTSIYGDPGGKKCYQYFTDRDQQCSDCGVRLALQKKIPVVTESVLPKENNRPVQIISIPYRDEKDAWMVAEINVDISERKKTEDALLESEENLKITLNSIGDAVIATDIQGTITRMNPVAEKLTGYTLNDARGKQFNNIITVINIKEKQQKYNPVQAVIEKGKIKSFEAHHTLIDRNGKEYQVAYSGAPIKNKQHETVGTVLVFRDMTEIYNIEEKLKQKFKLDSLGHLAGGIAHDFNNMLAGILGYTEILLKKMKDERLVSYVQTILKTTMNAADFTNKLLSFSRKGKIVSTDIDIHIAINEAVEILRHSIDRRITLVTNLKAENAYILGDPSQIQNIILNLGVNARDAMLQGGTITIATENVVLDDDYCYTCSFELEPGEYIKVSVNDTGSGISPDILQHIFEPFFTTKKQGKGTGLGLSAVYGAIKDHKGAIEVKSTPGQGACFCMYFPINKNVALAFNEYTNYAIPGKGSILVIEDEATIRSMVGTVLEDLGYSVLYAQNGKEGLEIYTQNSTTIDMVILDMIMPEMNGVDCFYAIMNVNPQAKIIATSGYTNEADIEMLQKDGLVDFIKKPFLETDLSKKIAQALHNNALINT